MSSWAITHVTENILSQVRAQQRPLTPDLITLVLEVVDQIKILLQRVELNGSEGEDDTGALKERLETAHAACPTPESKTALSPIAAVPVTTATAVISPAIRPVPPAPEVQPTPTTAPASANAPAPIPNVVPAPTLLEATPAIAVAVEPTGAAEGSEGLQLADSTIRVDVGLLNRLMNLVGELVLARNQLLQETSAQNSPLQQTSQRLNLITSELQEGMMKTRMQPIGTVWGKLPRVVRDLSSKCGKRVHLVMEGGTHRA